MLGMHRDDRTAEISLPGGNVGGAVRIGDTVRRPTGPWTPAVHELLGFLTARGLDAVPRVHGIDAQGREVLDYLPGRVVPLDSVTRAQLASAAAWLGRYHAVVAGFRPGRRRWRYGEADLDEGQLVCHNDAAVYNMVFDGDELVGVFDWDVAGPGRPVDDLAFLAWSGVPLYTAADDAVARLVAVTAGYAAAAEATAAVSPIAPAEVLDHVVSRMTAACDRIAAGQAAGDAGMLNLAAVGEPERTRAQVAAFAGRLPALRAALRAAAAG